MPSLSPPQPAVSLSSISFPRSQWASVKLSDLLITLESGSRPRGGVNGINSGVPSIGGEHLRADGGFSFTNIRYVPVDFAEKMNRGRIAIGDVLVVKDGATTGKVSFVKSGFPEPAVVNEHVFIARPSPQLLSAYIFYYLYSQAGRDGIMLDFRGAAQGGISQSFADKVIVPLAPLPEQRRIVAEIERQFSLLDAGVANLKRVQANLKRYRAAVLQAACTGQLVPTEAETARAEGRPYEPAAVLLTRILAERRARWEAEQLAKMEAHGKLPLNGAWKAKYQEPAAPDTSGLPELPKGWTWASLSMMTSSIGDVDHKMPKAVAEGIPYVSTKDFQGENDIDFERAKRITLEDYLALCRKIKPSFGDLLLSRYGTVGEVRYVRTEQPFQASYSVAILKMITAQITTEYVLVLMRSSVIQTQIKRDIRASAQPDLGLDYIRKFTIPFPPLAEQESIVAEVERRLSVVDNLEQVVKANLKRAERLRQAVLKEAFAGRLVPQDPADEPASFLLERIKAERETTQKEKKTPTVRAKAGTANGVQHMENGDIGAVSFEKGGQGAISL